MQFSLFFDFNLYLKLYFYVLLDFNAFKFVFLDFCNARQVIFFRYDGSIVLTTNRSIKVRSVLGVKYEEIIRCGNGGSVFA